MRKLVLALVLVAAVMPSAGGTAAAAQSPGCTFTFPPHAVTAVCQLPKFRALAECTSTEGTWSARGALVTTGRASTAGCGDARVTDYGLGTERMPPGCAREEYFTQWDGQGLRVYCQGRYRAVVTCKNLWTSFEVQGSQAEPGRGPSTAFCKGALVSDYYVLLA